MPCLVTATSCLPISPSPLVTAPPRSIPPTSATWTSSALQTPLASEPLQVLLLCLPGPSFQTLTKFILPIPFPPPALQMHCSPSSQPHGILMSGPLYKPPIPPSQPTLLRPLFLHLPLSLVFLRASREPPNAAPSRQDHSASEVFPAALNGTGLLTRATPPSL